MRAARDPGVRAHALIIEIGPSFVEVKVDITGEKPIAKDLNECDALIGRDFGYRNTVALTIVEKDKDVDQHELSRLLALTKEEARTYLESRRQDNNKVIEERLFCGARFLDRINLYSIKIDKLKSEIDLHYNRIGRLKRILAGYMGLSDGEMITREMTIDDPLVRTVYTKFLGLLDRVTYLKSIRRGLYRKIAKVKKDWFGYISNVEVELAKQYNGAIVRENLTVVTIGHEDPKYKGRTFNKMINNGSKGQYIRRASDKLAWHGVPELAVPSFYTSSTCIAHGLVDRAMRSGNVFKCPECGKEADADLHASEVIAQYLLLRPWAGASEKVQASGADHL